MSIIAQSADGVQHQFPDGTDPAVIDRVMKGYATQGKAAPQWSDLPGNILPSAANFAGSLASAVVHPVDTADALAKTAIGANLNTVDKLKEYLPNGFKWAANVANAPAYLNPIMLPGMMYANSDSGYAKEAKATAEQVGQVYKDRYGGLDAIKKTMIEDPVGVAADASALFSGGGSAIAEMAPAASRVSQIGKIAAAVGDATNPIAVVGKPLAIAAKSPVGELAGRGIAEVAAAPSGVGGEALIQALRDSFKGGAAQDAFKANMRGQVPADAVLQDANIGLQNMATNRANEYKAGMAATKANGAVLDYAPVDQAMQDLTASLYHGSTAVTDDASLKLLSKVQDKINEWKQAYPTPTPYDLDRLKVSIDKLAPNFTQASGDQGRIVTSMRNAVKNQILAADPNYAATMKSYETSKTLQSEIEKTLSTNGSKDTALRKLQSAIRNNVNTNYGNRVEAVKELEKAGAPNLMSSLAGQQFNSLAPRGLAKLLASGLTLTSGANPLNLAVLPLTSPRVIGEIANATGSAAGKASRGLEILKHLSPSKLQAIIAARITESAHPNH